MKSTRSCIKLIKIYIIISVNNLGFLNVNYLLNNLELEIKTKKITNGSN